MAKPLTSLTEEQLRWRSNDAQTRATRHAQNILLEILPGDKVEPAPHRYGKAPETPFADVRVNDVIAVNETGYVGSYREGQSVADFATDHRSRHYLVVRRTPSTLWVKPLHNPHHYGGGDLFALAFEPETSESYDPVYQWRESYSRYIVALGQHADLVQRVRNAQAYPRLVKANQTIALCAAESERRWEAERLVEERAQEAAEEMSKTLNEAIGFEVYNVSYSNTVERHRDWERVPEQAILRLLSLGLPADRTDNSIVNLFTEIEKDIQS